MDIYGIEPKEKKSTSGKEYYGLTVSDTDPWAKAFTKDVDTISKKFGVTGKKMILLYAVKIAAYCISKGYPLSDEKKE